MRNFHAGQKARSRSVDPTSSTRVIRGPKKAILGINDAVSPELKAG